MRAPRIGVFSLGKFEQYGVFQNKMMDVVKFTGRPAQVSAVKGTYAHELVSRWAYEEHINTKHIAFDRRVSIKMKWMQYDMATVVGFTSVKLLNPSCDILVGFVHEPAKNLQAMLVNEVVNKSIYLFEI